MIDNENRTPKEDPMLFNLTDPNQARLFISKARVMGVEMFEGRLPDGQVIKFVDASDEQICFFAQTLASYIDIQRRARKERERIIKEMGPLNGEGSLET